MSVHVKVCGITNVADGLVAARAGAHAIGLVFWPRSHRWVDIETARAITDALPPLVVRVGVFVDASRDVLLRTIGAVGLDAVQLHGDEAPEDLAGLPVRAVKALRVTPGFSAADVERFLGQASGILLDAGSAEQPGGTGSTFDWSLGQAVRERVSYLVLAGGLNAENVGQAIRALRPDAVDVSSGVESAPGRKDAAKVWAFIEAARCATRPEMTTDTIGRSVEKRG